MDLFDPNDGHYEYSAVTSNLGLTLREPLAVCVRAGQSREDDRAAEDGLAFHTVPTMAYAANSAWQHLVVLAHNLLTNFQIETGATRRAPTRKRTVLPCAPDDSDAPLRALQSRRAARASRGRPATATHR